MGIAARFWARVQVSGPDECWVWTGARTDNNYGVTRIQKRQEYAHRVAWMLTHGDLGALWVLHRCDNKPCCNPSHLFTGTHLDNMADAASKGLLRCWRARRRLAPDEIAVIRQRCANGPYGTRSAVAREYGVSPSFVSRIASGQTRVFDAPIERAS